MAMDVLDEELDCCLSHRNSAIRLNAVKALHRIAQRDYARALAAVRARQVDGNLEVRQAAVEVLSVLARAAEPGDGRALGMLVARLADWELGVRQLAVDALAQAITGMDEEAQAEMLTAICTHLKSWQGGVRRTAVSAMCVLARSGNERAVEALCSCLNDPDAEVRTAAIRALPLFLPEDPSGAAKGLGGHLTHAEADVRQLATRGLGCMVGKVVNAHPEIRALLLQHTSDPEAEVRQAAVEALAQVSQPGDLKALNALCSRLAVPPVPVPPDSSEESSDDGTEEEEEEAEGEQEETPEPPLEDDSSWAVRRAALQAIPSVVEPGDERVAEIVAARLQDESREVRRAALEALRALSPEAGGCRSLICIAAEGLDHPLAGVRLVAISALVHLLDKDYERAVTKLLEHTQHGEGLEVRRAALEALAVCVSTFNGRVVQAAVTCAEDPNADMRSTALRLLPELLQPKQDAKDRKPMPRQGAKNSRSTGDSRAAGRLTRPQGREPAPPQPGVALVFTAEETDARLGLGFASVPPAPVLINRVGLASWAERVGVEVGSELTELNEAITADMTPEELEEALEERPLTVTVIGPVQQADQPPEPQPEELRAAALAAMASGLRDRDARVRTAASQALAICGGEPAVRAQSMRVKQWLPQDAK